MGRTVRVRTALGAGAVIAVAVGLAATALVVLLHRSLLHNVDDRAVLRLRDVADLAERGQLPATLAGGDEDGTVAQVVAAGRVVAQSPVVRRPVPLADFVPAATGAVVRTVGRTPISDGTAYRVAAARVATPQGPAVVYVAASLEPVTDAIHSLELLLAAVGPALVLIVVAMTWLLVGRTLGPVEEIRRQVAEISALDLARRVPEPGTGDEIQRLAETMNAMLGRLAAAAGRQRRFVSDAAHELRGPLATIAAELDVAASHPDGTDWPAVVARLRAVTGRLGRLVEDLLVLATAEERGDRRRQEVDMEELVLRQLESLRATSPLAVDVPHLDAARVTGDRDQLERAVANVLDNARRHATSRVTVTLRVEDAAAELVVADDGPGVQAVDRERIFERFSRLDEARSRDRGGAGLGLSIARRIIENHAGSIRVAGTGPGTAMVIRLPLPDPDRPPAPDPLQEA